MSGHTLVGAATPWPGFYKRSGIKVNAPALANRMGLPSKIVGPYSNTWTELFPGAWGSTAPPENLIVYPGFQEAIRAAVSN
jgi:hypothetical protein